MTITRLRTGVQAWRGMRAFQRLDESFRRVVFYSESAADWPHLGPVVQELGGARGCRVTYLSSDLTDPGLALAGPMFRSFFIGSGSTRTILFRSIDCCHFVMTLPDLERFHLKRSVAPVHYVYLFHSLNSTHTSYRKGAFDAYDTILCVGPHHLEEIRRTEEVYGLPAKRLIEHGSVRLDALSVALRSRATAPSGDRGQPSILIAPSWGDCSLLERPSGDELISVLLQAGYRVVVRPHPMTIRRRPRTLPLLRDRHGSNPLFAVDENVAAADSWFATDLMISDWSGAAAEYSFSLGKPTVFIDTPQKLSNAEWRKLGLHAVEDSLRKEIGVVVAENGIGTVPRAIEACLRDPIAFRTRIESVRDRTVFNVGRSAAAAADYLSSLHVDASGTSRGPKPGHVTVRDGAERDCHA